MFRDLRYVIRLLRRSPAFTATVVLTLAPGIGLTTALFSVVDGVLLRPLPYADPARLVTVRSVSMQTWFAWKDRTQALSDIAAYDRGVPPLLLAGNEAVRLRRGAISPNLLAVLGVQPLVGRAFRPEDAAPGAEPVVILSHGVWQQYFGGRADIVGQIAPFEPVRLRVVGILPARFSPPLRMLAAFGEDRLFTPLPDASAGSPTLIARLNRGATLAQVQAEELTILRRAAVPGRAAPENAQASAMLLTEEIVGRSRRSLLFLFAASGILLLLACTSVGNLLFAKSGALRRELAVRVALGARRATPARLVARTTGAPTSIAARVREELRALDPRVPVENVRPLQALVGASIALPRFQTMLLGVFGGCALLLSVVGVSGVVAYGVSRRTREIAIRIALGAQAHDVARAVLGPTGVAVGIGLTLGLLATAGLSRIAQAFLYEIGPNDPLTLATVVAVLATAAVAAAIVPARRILAIDPVVALRSL